MIAILENWNEAKSENFIYSLSTNISIRYILRKKTKISFLFQNFNVIVFFIIYTYSLNKNHCRKLTNIWFNPNNVLIIFSYITRIMLLKKINIKKMKMESGLLQGLM